MSEYGQIHIYVVYVDTDLHLTSTGDPPMEGLALHSLTQRLYPVAPEHNEKPAAAVQHVGLKLTASWIAELTDRYDVFNFDEHYHRLPIEAFECFSFDDLCKLYHSTTIMMDQSVMKLFGQDAQYEVVRKIISSMWRWGYSKGAWNDIVTSHDNLRNFSLGDYPGFDLRLDYTTAYNERGYSKYGRQFLDGVFAFLVYYRGQHVWTIGFSILPEKKLLVQQVQSAQQTGNRWLFRLPRNRLEFVLELFARNFPGYELSVVDGVSLTERVLADYRSELTSAQERKKRYERHLKENPSTETSYYGDALKRASRECELFSQKISHLTADRARLAAFYANTGRFTLRRDEKIVLHRLAHYPVAV